MKCNKNGFTQINIIFLFIRDEKDKGVSSEEIIQKIENEFPSPKEMAEQIIGEYNKEHPKSNREKYLYSLIIASIVASVFLPDYKTFPTAILLFIIAYYVIAKNYLWVFAIYRKNPKNVKNKGMVSKLGGLYIITIGALLILLEFMNILMVIVIGIIIILTIGVYSYMSKQQIQ